MLRLKTTGIFTENMNGIVKRSKDCYEAYIDRHKVGQDRTLDAALGIYVREMLDLGQKIDPRTVMVFEFLPNEPVYKLIRIR